MKFSGAKDLEIELGHDNSVRITTRYTTSYEAAIAYDELSTAAKSGRLKVNFSLGEVLEEEGPTVGGQ